MLGMSRGHRALGGQDHCSDESSRDTGQVRGRRGVLHRGYQVLHLQSHHRPVSMTPVARIVSYYSGIPTHLLEISQPSGWSLYGVQWTPLESWVRTVSIPASLKVVGFVEVSNVLTALTGQHWWVVSEALAAGKPLMLDEGAMAPV